MKTEQSLCKQANQMDLVTCLETLGYQPQKIRGNDYWYLSPLRDEKTASFKVNRKLNAWFDHGLGKGGNLIDFGILYHRCTVSELLQKLRETFSFHQQSGPVQQPPAGTQNLPEALEPTVKVIAATSLTSPALCRYLEHRKILLTIAKIYCKEVQFELNGRNYFAIGFENNRGGFELRNSYFKGCSSPKDSTIIKHPNCENILVFEGFFSFLSYLTLQEKMGKNSLEQLPKVQTNFLVLNSLSFFPKAKLDMEKYPSIHLYLDRDKAGIKTTLEAVALGKGYQDKSHLYKGYKDLNDYLINQRQEQKQRLRQGRHL